MLLYVGCSTTFSAVRRTRKSQFVETTIRVQTSSSVLQHCLHCFPRGVDKNSVAQSCGTPCMILFRFKQSAKQTRLPQIVMSDNEGQAGKFLVIPFQRFHIIFMVSLCTNNIFDFAWQVSQSLIRGFHKQQLRAPLHGCTITMIDLCVVNLHDRLHGCN